MSDILIRPQELRQTADQLQATARKIDAALQAIDNDMLSLKRDNFLGNRANAVQAHYAPKREALLKAKEIASHFSEDLRDTATRFEQADKKGVDFLSNDNGTSQRSINSHVLNIPPRNYAIFSKLAYSDSPELPDKLKEQGWEVLTTAKNEGFNKDGYSGVAFINRKTGEIVIAHRGSDLNPFDKRFYKEFTDIDDDFNIAIGRIPDQYQVSREFLASVKKKLDKEGFSDYSLTHTGHSLGGALSQLNALADHTKGIAFDAPSVLQIVKNNTNIFSPDERVNLVNYQSNPNLVTTGRDAGYVVQIIPEEGGAINPLWNGNPITKVVAEFKQLLIHHSLDNIIESMDPVTGFPVANFPPQGGDEYHGSYNLHEYEQGQIKGVARACYEPPPLDDL